ncbi:MAG TPA: tRNA dihydrouridine synthase DusB [Tepidisphaeraceae bacterium]|nr:tRNA dihydrouridine synthase DusB [Tepidisphaeraceae bacterium]
MLPVAPLQIGSVRLATNLLLAPIAGYCDLGFRLVCRSLGGVGMACTDLLCPQGVLRENYRSMILAATCPEDAPLCMQLYGGGADPLVEAARWAEDRGAHVVDINMGCPVDKITKRDGGSKLLCDVDNTLRLVEKVRAALRHTPLTAKLRLGWDDSCIVAPRLAARLEDAGVQLVTVHGRTTEMRFGGQCRLDGIAAVVAAVKRIPVVGNGDVKTPHDAAHMLAYTRCAGVMIGRGALSMPWIFRDTWSYLTTGTVPPPPTVDEKVDLMRQHFRHYIAHRGERATVAEFRKRISWYAKQLHPCHHLRQDMRLMRDAAHFEVLVKQFLDWRRERDEDLRAGRLVPEPAAELAAEMA